MSLYSITDFIYGFVVDEYLSIHLWKMKQRIVDLEVGHSCYPAYCSPLDYVSSYSCMYTTSDVLGYSVLQIYRESLSKDPSRYPEEVGQISLYTVQCFMLVAFLLVLAYLVQRIEQIFGNINDLHELSVQLFGMVEDCLEMVSDSEGGQGKCPQLGACFAELALVSPPLSTEC